MANTIISLKASGVSSNVVTPTSLAFGELALNYADSILYFRTASDTLGSIKTSQPGGLNQEIQFNDSGVFGGSNKLTFNKTTGLLQTTGNVSVGNTLNVSNNIVGAGAANSSITGFTIDANTSNKLLLKRSSVNGYVPTISDLDYGEISINYNEGKIYYRTTSDTIESITSGQASQTFTQIDRKSYTATESQTTFSVTYANNYVDVYVNGAHLSDEDYTATNQTSITLTQACSANDQVDLVGYSGGLVIPGAKANGDILVYDSSTAIWVNQPQSTLIAGNATKLANARVISISGDVVGNVTFDGSANAEIVATIQPNSVALGTDTTGNYMIEVTAVEDINVSHTQSEGSTATITHANIARTNTTSSDSPTRNGSFTVVDSITTNARGHVTAVNTKTVTMPDYEIVTFTKSLTLTTDWIDTGIKATDLSTGSYIVQLLADDNAVSGQHYTEYYSGIMSWFGSNTNDTKSDEIVLHRAGYGIDGSAVIYLRTLRTVDANADDLKLQISSTVNASGASNYIFKFRRMI